MQVEFDLIRGRLTRLIEQHREDMAGLSRMLGHRPGYVRDFLKRGTPQRLPDRDREMLAGYFNVDGRDLGARSLRKWKLQQATKR